MVTHRWHRQSIRLRCHDYGSDGGYFITMVTHRRRHLFGMIHNGRMTLSPAGRIASDAWYASAAIRAEIVLDAFVVMPDHIHGIVVIRRNRDDHPAPTRADVRAHGNAPRSESECDVVAHGNAPRSESECDVVAHGNAPHQQRRTLGTFVRGYKGEVTRRINAMGSTSATRVWQRNYYERIIRTDRDWAAIARYIAENPRNWAKR